MVLDRLAMHIARPATKAVVGAGAWAMENYPAIADADYRKRDNRAQRTFIREALGLYHSNRHILRAERLVASRVAGLDWHLEDEDGEEVNDESQERYVAIRDLLEKPTGGERVGSQPRSWRELTGVTVRHMGLANVAFWYLDEIDRFTRWPRRILYLRPDRMTPAVDKAGNLTGWILDYREREGTGTPLDLDQVLPFYLEVPDEGFYGDGLVEAAVALGRKLMRSDRHELDVLSAGGRLPGILSPRGESVPKEVFDRLTNDMRNIVEMPDAAKRTLIARAPIDFTPTSANPTELSLPELARLGREELYGLWGIHPTVAGFTGAAGLNSGERGNYEEAWTWQNGVQPRVDALYETLQYQLLDRLDPVGINLQLVLHTPTFDDDMPKYDMAQKALDVPLRNVERRAILGLDPFGDPALDNAVWMPINVVPAADAPATGTAQAKQVEEPTLTKQQAEAVGALIRAGFKPIDALRALGLPEIKHTGLLPITLQQGVAEAEVAAEALGKASLVDRVRETSTKRITRDVAKVLAAMRKDIAERVRSHAAQLAKKPADYQAWMPKSQVRHWEQELERALKPHTQLAAETVGDKVASKLARKADAGLPDRVLARLLGKVGKRIGGIVETTREMVQAEIAKGIAEGLGAAELGDRIEAAAAFDEYRAELIARTETATVLNEAQVESFREFNVERVTVIDGDQDEECASANGQTWTLDEALDSPLAHPNCVRDFSPVIGGF